MDTPLFSLWAKTDRRNVEDGSIEFHPLIYHLLDVAACGKVLLCQERPLEQLAKSCNVDADELSQCFVALLALHDIGKCASGFQGKVLDLWPNILGTKPDAPLSVRHDAAGVWLFRNDETFSHISERMFPNLCPSSRLKIAQAICGHHGEPIDVEDIRNPNKQIGALSRQAAGKIAEAIIALLQPPACCLPEDHVARASFSLAGLAVLADWLGSNRAWFAFTPPPQSGNLAQNMLNYWEGRALPTAARALQEAGLISASISPNSGLATLFDPSYEPTPVQKYAENVVLRDGPLLFIVEDMTGAGKTEAAVLLAHRLMQAGKAKGLFVALPTMATANAMFTRLASSYRKLFDGSRVPSIVLTHGRRALFPGFATLPDVLATCHGSPHDTDDPSEIEASAFCADWIARSNKQAFLAQVGAGTIDQAILSVLPARHQSMRLWGIMDKVLIIDEAHAYDAYMNTEIECLLGFHAALGGSAIVLSATLPTQKRASLANAFLDAAKCGEKSNWRPSQSAYPLVTAIAAQGCAETPVALRGSLARQVKVERLHILDQAHDRALEAARQGGAVALIRNTVDEAIASHEALSPHFADVRLFHARFATNDRQSIEAEVVRRFGKDGRGDRNAILVATQVVEQSLDLDFDLVISDLAPVDLLIQRAGRLWRHARERPIPGPNLLVLTPEPSDDAGQHWPAPLLPRTNFIYKNAALLWRSAKAIFTAGKIVSRTSATCAAVETGEIRALVEAVYGDAALAIPPSLQSAENQALGAQSGERTQARYTILDFAKGYDWDGTKWERDTRARTRLGEDTITLRLARVDAGQIVPWAPIEGGDIRGAWALSEVSLRRSRCSGVQNPGNMERPIIDAQRDWTLSEREIPTLVLSPPDAMNWRGTVRDKQGNTVAITYSSSTGFRFAL